MLRGIDATKAGMLSVLEYNDNLAHSLANVNTTAFKQTKLAFKNIQESAINAINAKDNNLEASNSIGKLSQGSLVDAYVIDFSQGTIKETGRTLDFAINGEGFFKMRMGDGSVAYSRNGVFQIQHDGTITDNQGNPVMNKEGIVKIDIMEQEQGKLIDFDKLVVRQNGEIYYDKRQYGKIDLYDFADKTKVRDLGEGRFVSTDETSNPATIMNNANIEQGAIELSNANSILTMINSINAHRTYESMVNVMKTNSQTLEKAISTVGRVTN